MPPTPDSSTLFVAEAVDIFESDMIITHLCMPGLDGFISDPDEVMNGQRLQVSVHILKLSPKHRAQQARRLDGKAIGKTVRTRDGS